MKWILVPTDYSACANNAARYAIALARQGNYRILFFHSVHSLKNDAELLVTDQNEYYSLRKKHHAYLLDYVNQQYAAAGFKPARISVKINFGESLAAHLYELMADKKFSMLVMGTHGKGRSLALTGSNTRKMIEHSPIPVLSIPGRAGYKRIKELVYLTDIKNYTQELKKLAPLSRNLKAPISVVHYDYGWDLSADENKQLKRLKNKKGIKFSEMKVSIAVPIISHIKFSRRPSSSLFCLFHDHKNLFYKVLTGSASEEASMKLRRPILSLQRPGAV